MKECENQHMKAAQAGNMDAFAALFEPMRSTLVRIAAGIVGDSDAEDVVMEAMLKVWRALPGFRQTASLRTWVIRIVRNQALDVVRGRSRRREVTLEREGDRDEGDATVAEIPDPDVVHPGEAMVAREREEEIAEALTKLETVHRRVLELRFMENMSYNEIAQATGVSLGTVMSRLFYAKRKLARVLSGSTPEPRRSPEREVGP